MKYIAFIFFSSIAFCESYSAFGVQFPFIGDRLHARIHEAFFEELSQEKNFFLQSFFHSEVAIKKIKSAMITNTPNVVFLPDDLLFSLYRDTVPSAIKVGIFFYTQIKNIPKDLDTIALHVSLDIADITKKLKNALGIKRILAMGGPFSKEILKEIIRGSSSVHVDVMQPITWEDWQSAMLENQKNYDALWILLPFGVKHKNGATLDWKAASSWMKDHIKIPTLGWVSTNQDFPRLLNFPVDPDSVGRCAARALKARLKNKPEVDCSHYIQAGNVVTVHRELAGRFDLSKLPQFFLVEMN